MKKIMSISFVLISLYFQAMLWGQTGSYNIENPETTIDPKSPEVSSLGKYITMPLHLNTGTASIEIPMYTLQYGDITLPISLRYDSSGIKVGDMASAVGLKWNLNYGGVLTRNVRGRRDEGDGDVLINPFNNSGSPPIIKGWYKDYGLTALTSFLGDDQTDVTETEGYNTFLSNAAINFYDSQPDLFAFHVAGGGSAKFFFDEQRTPVLFTQSDVQIVNTLPSYDHLRWSDWQFKIPNGHYYVFGASFDTKEYYATTDIAMNRPYAYPLNDVQYLSRIVDPKSGREITIEYDKESYQEITFNFPDVAGIAAMPSHSNAANNVKIALRPLEEEYRPAVFSTSCIPIGASYAPCELDASKINRTFYEKPVIKRIIAGDTELRFAYSATNREDLYPSIIQYHYDENVAIHHPKALETISIYYGGKLIKSFKLTTSYYVKDPAVNVPYSLPFTNSTQAALDFISYAEKRLRLDAVEKVSTQTGVASKIHEFTYNSPYLSSRLSLAQDMWGYYNGHDQNKSPYKTVAKSELN
jgi:hypothetical protein